MISKPRCFNDLLKLQRILDENIEKNRNNGFVPRKRNVLDILLAIDDEFQEWLRELPYEYNFKSWKQKEYSREKELEEFVDILFFFLQYVNYEAETDDEIIEDFEEFFYAPVDSGIEISCNLLYWIKYFKGNLWCNNVEEALYCWILIAYIRRFDNEIFDAYWKKWQFNMGRQNKDWVIQE